MAITRRRAFLLVASCTLSVVLISLLIRIGKIDLRLTLQQLESVSWVAFMKLVVLTGFHVYLSNQKWRTIDAVLRKSTDSVPSRSLSFAFTSIGVALGQILPTQVSMSGARTLGTYFHGRALKRGTVGTLFEQSFDVLTVAFLAIASLITWLTKGGALVWAASAIVVTAVAMLSVGPLIDGVRKLAALFAARSPEPQSWMGIALQKLSELQHSALLNPSIARRLTVLSALRFVIQVLMAGQAAEAIGVQIPLWHLAAAMPFVVIACVLAITPGGLGVNELSYAAALNLFGTPLSVGASWALANRVLVASLSLLVALCGAVALIIGKVVPSGERGEMQKIGNGY